MKTKCGQCGGEFTARHGKRFCCAKCKWTWTNRNRTLKPNVRANCTVCGNPFERYVEPSKIASGRATGEYCSLACKGKALSGDKHPLWKGGRCIVNGYVWIHQPEHPNAKHQGYVLEHRLVMEKYLDRLLTDIEVVHHVDDNPLNNDLGNLRLYGSNADHKRDDIAFRERNALGQLVPKKEEQPVASETQKATCEIFNEDCISGMERRISSGSAHLIVTSIPFEEL